MKDSRRSVGSNGVNAATYSYLANSPLVGQIAFAHSGTTEMTTVKEYDYLNRLSSTATSSNSFAYLYSAADQRTQAWMWDGSYWVYQYDALGQVIAANKYWSDQTPVAGQQFNYTFDTIGNRTQTLAGGDQNGANLRTANYTNNSLNQITSRGVPAFVDVSFLWGLDLSGSSQGAGGVGGLVEVTSYAPGGTTNCFSSFDGNGNVSGLFNATNSAALANYEYGPFGEVIRATGPMAKANPFRWSTKYQDDETDLDYYGYRYYNPSTGRWLSRDPLLEVAFAQNFDFDSVNVKMTNNLNQYEFVDNNPFSDIDYLGASLCDCTYSPPKKVDFTKSTTINSLSGRVTCTTANQGATATISWGPAICAGNFITGALSIFGCKCTTSCSGTTTFKCGIGPPKGPNATGIHAGKPAWLYTSYAITTPCKP